MSQATVSVAMMIVSWGAVAVQLIYARRSRRIIREYLRLMWMVREGDPAQREAALDQIAAMLREAEEQ